ncbi:MAG: class I tRNA ligase family protein, partial [Patescibacteria group bacterium]
ADKQLLQELVDIAKDVTGDYEEYRFHLAAEKLYHYLWHRFADTIIEESKSILAGEDEHAKQSRQQLLMYILKNSLIMLHPCMPFITEEIWQHMQRTKNTDATLLMVEEWPTL